MKPTFRASRLLCQLLTLPLSALGLSRGKRVLIVAFSYAVGVPGLWFGLMTCWLRTAVDLMQKERSRALAAEQERLQVTLAYQYQRQLNELKDQFLLNVNHELRTPLTVLGGSLELLQAHDEHLEASKRAQILTLALENHEELVNLVNRVLDAINVVSDIPRVQPEIVCVHQLLQEVLAQLDPRDCETYTICLQVPEHIMVWADPKFLRQVVQETPSSPVCLTVQDAGPGIPAKEPPLLFEKFVRLKGDLAGKTRGTGLGLYICRRAVEAMEGRIWVESSGRAGEGSRFCVSLPPVPLFAFC